MSDVEETLNRIKTHKSVQGIVIVNNEGNIIRTTYTADRKEEGENIARTIPQLTSKARSTIRDLDPTVIFVIKEFVSDNSNRTT